MEAVMKRNMKLIRELLFYIEKNASEYDYIRFSNYDVIRDFAEKEYSKEAVNYHLSLMHDAGFIIGDDPMPIGQQGFWLILRLTYSGHDFLDTIRDEKTWKKFIEKFVNDSKEFTLRIAPSVAAEIARQFLP